MVAPIKHWFHSANHKSEFVVYQLLFIQVEGTSFSHSVDEIAWNYPVLYVVKPTGIFLKTLAFKTNASS